MPGFRFVLSRQTNACSIAFASVALLHPVVAVAIRRRSKHDVLVRVENGKFKHQHAVHHIDRLVGYTKTSQKSKANTARAKHEKDADEGGMKEMSLFGNEQISGTIHAHRLNQYGQVPRLATAEPQDQHTYWKRDDAATQGG